MAIKKTQPAPPSASLPRHVGLIMDGNGRWAARRGLPRNMGHRQGAEAFRKISRHANSLGIEYLTVYALSTENLLRRPAEEIDTITELLRTLLDEAEKSRDESGRIVILGDIMPFDAGLRGRIADIQRKTAHLPGMTLNIALNYGGRAEILRAAKELFRRYLNGETCPIDDLTEDDFAACLYTAGQPDVDLVIRTSGEKRVSNFLLWQGAYAEYVFPDTLFPDFTPAHFDEALKEYSGRSRRMGGA